MHEELLTADEAAAALRVSTKTVLRHIKSGQLRASKVGRAWRIRRGDLPCLGSPASGVVYLDDNGSSPIAPAVVEAIAEVLTHPIGNASSSHAVGQRSRARIEEARERVAALVGARPSEVVFTSGATEANNLILRGLAPSAPGVVISAGEHDSVSRVVEALHDEGLVTRTVVGLTSVGSVDLDELDAYLARGGIGLVSIVAANGETGVLNPVEQIAQRVHAAGALLHCDATQWVGRLPWSMSRCGADAISLSAHKMNGPQGVGALVARRGLLRRLRPVQLGGGHENGLRSGSYNVAGIVGLGVAAGLAAAPSDAARVAGLRDQFVDRLSQSVGAVLNGSRTQRLPNTANLRFAGAPGDAVLARCPSVAASLGSACHAGAIEPSPTLLSMGLSRTEAGESMRFSLTRFTTAQDVDRAASEVARAVREVRVMQEVA